MRTLSVGRVESRERSELELKGEEMAKRKTKASREREAILTERVYRALMIVGWLPEDADDAMLVLGILQRAVESLDETPHVEPERVILDAFREIGWSPTGEEAAYAPTTVRNALGIPEPVDAPPTLLQRLRLWFGTDRISRSVVACAT